MFSAIYLTVQDMLRKKRIHIEASLLEDIDSIIKKVQKLSEKGYQQWSVSREDLIRFAVASTFGLAYPYVNVDRKVFSKVLGKTKKN
ncbi:MAG: hypothetical protein WCY34_00835 [Candidatus Omnitrophota bacterium]